MKKKMWKPRKHFVLACSLKWGGVCVSRLTRLIKYEISFIRKKNSKTNDNLHKLHNQIICFYFWFQLIHLCQNIQLYTYIWSSYLLCVHIIK